MNNNVFDESPHDFIFSQDFEHTTSL